jgi:hypothetical protein
LTQWLVAQQQDFVGVTGLSVSKKLNRSWDVSLGSQASFNQNLHELWFAYADASIGYSFNRNFSTELHMRQIEFRSLENSYERRQLFYHTLQWNKGFGKWSISVRNRLQQLVYGISTTAIEDQSGTTVIVSPLAIASITIGRFQPPPKSWFH